MHLPGGVSLVDDGDAGYLDGRRDAVVLCVAQKLEAVRRIIFANERHMVVVVVLLLFLLQPSLLLSCVIPDPVNHSSASRGDRTSDCCPGAAAPFWPGIRRDGRRCARSTCRRATHASTVPIRLGRVACGGLPFACVAGRRCTRRQPVKGALQSGPGRPFTDEALADGTAGSGLVLDRQGVARRA
jgi:hypothetical protein